GRGAPAGAARLCGLGPGAGGLGGGLRDEAFPATPTVVGLLRGDRPGPRIALCAHLDTVPIPHDGPARIEGTRIYGRGSADMKGACVAALETARVMAGRSFAGRVAAIGIGPREAPGGRGEDLTWLLGEGNFRCDLGLVCELSGHDVAVAHMGQATAEITITRRGMPTHELQTPKGTPHPLLAAARVIEAVRSRGEELAAVEHPWGGVGTYFGGEG